MTTTEVKEEQKAYVCLPWIYDEGKHILSWALSHFSKDETKIVATSIIATLIPNHPRYSIFRNMRREVFNETLDKHVAQCAIQKFKADKLIHENNGYLIRVILELIELKAIKNLVMWSSSDSELIKEKANPSCKIWFIQNGNLIYTRYPTSDLTEATSEEELREVNSKPCTPTKRSIIETYVKQEKVPFVMKDAPSCVGRLMKIRDDLCEIQLKLEDKIAQCEMDIQTIRDEEQMKSEEEKIVERWENAISSGQLDASVGCPNSNKKKKFKLRSSCQILDDNCRDNKLALPRYNVHPISNGLYLASATLKSKGVDCMAESELKKNPHEAREHAALLLMQKLNEMEED